MYSEYLITTLQLAAKKKARVVIGDHLISIEALNGVNRWKISAKVFHTDDGSLPSDLQDCLKSMRWHRSGPFLQLDPLTGSVYLIEEVEMPLGKFIPFRNHLKAFTASISDWNAMFSHSCVYP